ncbi:Protein C25H3.8 [Aphelenchoides avenae]|nr:Protein C25H3.8 [Aphelenchus avenae]
MEKKQKTYQLNGHVNQIQVDNQLLTTERWQVLYCEVNALKGDADSIDSHADALSAITMQPALKLEMNCTPMENYDAFDCFRIKLCDMCVLLDETLLWKFVQFIQETGTADSVQPKTLLQPPNIEPESVSMSTPTRRCYFGTLDLEVGNLSLSVGTVPKNSLSRELRRLKEQFNIKLVSFENALVTLPPFRQFHYFETLKFLVETLSQFYMAELQKQTLNIVVTMDAFGNPLGLVTDLRESFQGLLFEGDVGGFVSGLGYGVTNSISKVASSMAHGVGSLTFDEQHEVMRRKMLRSQSQQENTTALSHLYGGLKGLGVGVFGGLTAIAKNTIAATREDGAAGVVRGITTGAVDTVTKPVQGMLDLVEGAASALKDVVGGPLVRKSHFPETRVRLPRVCTNLQSLLPCYARELADAQQELLRISGYATNEILLDVVVFLTADVKGQRSVHRALICTEQCYVLKQIDDHSSTVVQRIPYKYLKNVQPSSTGLNSVEFTYEQNSSAARRATNPHLWCNSREIAIRLSDKVLRAKQLYDHAKRTLSVVEDYEQSAGY